MFRFRKTKATIELESALYSHAQRLYRLAYARLGHAQDAEDIVQETYLKAFRALSSFKEGTNAEAWLVQILLNTIRDHFRHVKRTAPTVPLDENEEASKNRATKSPEQKFVESEFDEAVLSAMKATPEWLLTPLLLREIHDMSYKELAETLDVPIGTIMSRLSRARLFMRQQLSGQSGDSGHGARDKTLGKTPLKSEEES
ncbi:MAG: RNA polymerase subunit sigma-24 [Cyanobacteria bacterium PR.023]|nr:RNA polymerase subunit sigma-24 [Cyanobacteria bacterium DS2.008]MBA4075373.1 RNA polymerase subunit sigma-24 [Cyanobacteria bacterium PR.023]